jgi:5-formyltetrahydrofolate cyclo-ligase
MKQKLREKHLKKREALSATQLEKKSLALTEQLFLSKEFQNAKTIMVFVSIKNEPKTNQIIEKAFALGKTVCVPLSNFSEKTILPVSITSISQLEKKPSGLIEPKDASNAVALEKIDLIIVPGLAFDFFGNRIGYGTGFFDRVLAKTHCQTIGLCFEQHLEKRLPVEEHDKSVKKIVTEKRIIDCEKESLQNSDFLAIDA